MHGIWTNSKSQMTFNGHVKRTAKAAAKIYMQTAIEWGTKGSQNVNKGKYHFTLWIQCNTYIARHFYSSLFFENEKKIGEWITENNNGQTNRDSMKSMAFEVEWIV